ncbi:hypothetical protein DFH94DRAFT_697039 [Russula ochroleuca]|uniref:Uncharacterized protein n=1 Tax=Russula ochroleuca TaxID=152965 RepID=A0A9P5JY34_9AGAM|nr:hypothetical protein DFH94DRAFT_697039 [Russula ochroleuca]
MHVGTQCEFEGKGVDREDEGVDHEDEGMDCEDEGVDCEDEGMDCEGEGEEHGQKCQGMGVSIETWCLGKCKGVWWAKAKFRKVCGPKRAGARVQTPEMRVDWYSPITRLRRQRSAFKDL